MDSREPNYGSRIEQILGSVTGDYTGELDAPSARIEYLVKKIKASIATGASDDDIKTALMDSLKDYVKKSDVQPDTNTTYTFKQDATDPSKFIFEGSDGTKAEVNIPKAEVPTKVSELENDAGFVARETLDHEIANCAKKADLPDLTLYAKKADIPAAPDLSDYAKKSDIQPQPDYSTFATKDEIPKVPTKVSELENDVGVLTSGDLSGAGSGSVVLGGEDRGSDAKGSFANALGRNSHADGNYSTADGYEARSSGFYSHAEGNRTTASGETSHAQNDRTVASGSYSHAEGTRTEASGTGAHAEGGWSKASGDYSHAENDSAKAIGKDTHAEGLGSQAIGDYSHAQGMQTRAGSKYQMAFGKYNVQDDAETYAEIVGNGTNDTARSNARTLDWAGNETLAGKLTVGADPTGDMDVATKKYVDGAVSVSDYFAPKIEKVDALPTEKDPSKIYFIKEDSKWAGYALEPVDQEYKVYIRLVPDPDTIPARDIALMVLWSFIFG